MKSVILEELSLDTFQDYQIIAQNPCSSNVKHRNENSLYRHVAKIEASSLRKPLADRDL